MWDDAEVISTYSRQEAIADGLLFECEEEATEAGWDMPVLLSLGIHSDFEGAALVTLLRTLYALRERDPNADRLELPGEREIWACIDEDFTATVIYPEER